jgi:transketolase
LLGERGRENKASFIGMSGFGVSAPAEVIYQQMGITADATVAAVKSLL